MTSDIWNYSNFTHSLICNTDELLKQWFFLRDCGVTEQQSMSCKQMNPTNLIQFTVGDSVPVWWETSSQLPATSSLITVKTGLQRGAHEITFCWCGGFALRNCSQTRAWWRIRTSSFKMSPFTHLLLLLILAYTHVKHVQQWSGPTLKMPTVTDLRKQSMTCSCKWPQQTFKLDGWVGIWTI